MARHVHQHVHQHLTSQPEVDNDNDNNNPWPFSSSASKEHVSLKSGWSIGRANEEAYKAGYKGDVPFRTWLKSKKLDDRSSGQISQLGRSYDDGVAKEHEALWLNVVVVVVTVAAAVGLVVVVLAGVGAR